MKLLQQTTRATSSDPVEPSTVFTDEYNAMDEKLSGIINSSQASINSGKTETGKL